MPAEALVDIHMYKYIHLYRWKYSSRAGCVARSVRSSFSTHSFCTIALYIWTYRLCHIYWVWLKADSPDDGRPNVREWDTRSMKSQYVRSHGVLGQSLLNLALMVVDADNLSSFSYRQVIYYHCSPKLAHFSREFHSFSVSLILAWRRGWWVRSSCKIGLGFTACSLGHKESASDLSLIEALQYSPIRSVD